MGVQDTANKIIKAIGRDNIESVSHCATRIRLVPKNAKNINKVEETELIKGSLFSNNQFQVFVHLSGIEEVYQEIKRQIEETKI